MAIEVQTKDCTALSDAELSEMADICADGTSGYEVGLLSKQRDFQGRWDWMNWIFVGHRPGLRVSAIPTSGHRVGRASIIAYWRD